MLGRSRPRLITGDPCSKQYWRDVGPILHAILVNIGCQYWPNISGQYTIGSAGQKIGGMCKQGAIIFHRDRVVVNFILKFVAMATGVGRGNI